MSRNRLFLLSAILLVAALIQPSAGQTLPPLHIQGRQLLDSKGKVVLLRGVNIGGWLVTESWMCGQRDDGGRKALEQLEKRFGPEKAAILMNAWQDNWITAADLDIIQKYGCNLLRVPFSYRTLQDAAGNWRRDSRRNIDFARMDWIVKEAQLRSMYVIFDLHVWPGDYHAISRDTGEGKLARAQMAALWTEVARHYRNVPAIAAFDVTNEPEGSPGNILQKAFYEAIRTQDSQRLMVFESVAYPSIRGERWTNIIWSAHYPENSLKTGSVRERLEEFDRKEKISATANVRVPVFIGEMKAPADNAASATELGKALNDRGWNWAVWTYKGVDNGGWASMNYGQSLKYNLTEDSYETILEKWTTGISSWRDRSKTGDLRETTWWIEGFGRAFRGETSK
ncbi:MAG: cellulase family glycosylhydrolase [Tepidisphaeraceae bacterium]|jgi:aryl-phospho-beta-D-glucosidase BglC (GH1 family)